MEGPLKNIVYLTRYLRQHCLDVGKKAYMISYIRLEHGTGTGFGAVSNTGSADCLKEQFRNLGVRLGAKFDRLDQIYFKTKKGLKIKQSNRTEHNLRVEHSLELAKDLFPMYEREFIINGTSDTDPMTVMFWLIKHHVAVAIHPSEQKTGDAGKKYKKNNFKYPFSKYSGPVFYKGIDISNYTYKKIQDINLSEHSNIQCNFTKVEKDAEKLFNNLGKVKPIKQGHKLAPLSIANKFYNNEISLLNEWYIYKKNKLFNGSKWSKSPKAKQLLSVLK